MISPEDVDGVAEAADALQPAEESYLEDDFVMNLLETVLDYQMNTKAVVRALEHFKENRWDHLRTIEDLEETVTRFPDDQAGNTALAQHLWGYNLWTRAQQLRNLVGYFRSIGVVNPEDAAPLGGRSNLQGRLRGPCEGLGIAVYHWLVMRQGVDTVKPDFHVRRFAEAAVGRPLSDQEVVDVVTRAAHQLGLKAFALDWRIWEASRGGALPYPRSDQTQGT